jgi:hypothetical protein
MKYLKKFENINKDMNILELAENLRALLEKNIGKPVELKKRPFDYEFKVVLMEEKTGDNTNLEEILPKVEQKLKFFLGKENEIQEDNLFVRLTEDEIKERAYLLKINRSGII